MFLAGAVDHAYAGVLLVVLDLVEQGVVSAVVAKAELQSLSLESPVMG